MKSLPWGELLIRNMAVEDREFRLSAPGIITSRLCCFVVRLQV
jgi:hypothetical protein